MYPSRRDVQHTNVPISSPLKTTMEKHSHDDTGEASDRELSSTAEALRSLNVNGEALALRISDSLVEYHANIGCYQCYLFLESHKQENTTAFDVSTLSVCVEFPRVELTCKREIGQEVVWWTEIERNVDVSQCTVEEKEDHWYLRLPIRSSDKQPLGGFSSFTQVSPVELRPESYASVGCRGCNAQLLDGERTSRIEKVLPLPSANWMDMFDFWGAGIGAFEHIPRDDIHAQQHRVLVGESYVLLHTTDLIEGTTTHQDETAAAPGDSAKDEHEWKPLTCATCSERIGLCNVEQPDTLRLHKHLISAHRRVEPATEGGAGQEEKNVFAKYTIDSILSAKLLEMADSDGIFRFILTSSDGKHEHGLLCGKQESHVAGDTSTTELQLQLLSWETMIKQQDTNKFRRVLKVLYGPRQPMPAIPGLLPSHEVSLPPAMCSVIAQRLQTSSTLLPSSLRTFNRMSVGYLFA